MGFFEKLKLGRLFSGKQEAPILISDFLFRGNRYIIEEFDIEFKLDVDKKNKPYGETYGGIITATLADEPDEWINIWMINTLEKSSGEFRFLKNDGKIDEGSLFSIIIEDAVCIGYKKIINPMGNGLLTTLTISPRIIRIGNEDFEKRWKYDT